MTDRSEHTDTARALRTSTGAPALRLDFWRLFRQSMVEGAPELKLGRATSEGWIHTDCALNGGTLIAFARVRDHEIGVQFAMDDATASTIHGLLRAHRTRIEEALSRARGTRSRGPVVWKTTGPRSYALESRRPGDIADRAAWPGYFAWLREHLLTVRESLAPILGREPAPGKKRQWDEASFFAELGRHNPASVPPARAILDWSAEHMPAVYWGHGRQFGSFLPGISRRGRTHTAISIWTSGAVTLRFAALKKLPPFDDRSLRLELLERFNEVPLFDLPDEVADLFPVIPLTAIDDEGSLAAFLSALGWFADAVRRT